MGHDIAPGTSYCPHGHPIALEEMPFANDQYGGGYGQQPPQPGGFGAPPPQPGYGSEHGYGQPFPDPNAQYGGGYGQQPPQPGGFGAPPPQPGYGQQPFAPAGPGGFGAPPASPQQAGFGGGGDYAPPPPPQGFAPPPQGQNHFGGQPAFPPPQQPVGFPSSAPDAPGTPGAAPAPPLPSNALRGFLVSYQSNAQGDFWALNGGRKSIGRANSGEQVDIPLTDATISSRHATLVIDGVSGAVHVEDTGSTNGTFVNEEHIGFNGKRDLRDGDKLRFGGYTTIVKIVG